MELEEEKICRYCFDGEEVGELISPCNCSGGQKYVHTECLKRWQRMLIVSSPTHPAFQHDDLRDMECNVCKSKFTHEPPSRHELMSSFTGPEIAALIDIGCIIGAGIEFSIELAQQLESMPSILREVSSYDHWLRAAYLITGVEEDDGLFNIKIENKEELERFRNTMQDGCIINLRGKRLKLTRRGNLSTVEDDASLNEAIQSMTYQNSCINLVFEEVNEEGNPIPRDCGDDHVTAVNLCRPQARDFATTFSPARGALERALSRITDRHGKLWAARARSVEVIHHKGGPCDSQQIVHCLVPGASRRGYTLVNNLEDALLLAARLATSIPSSLNQAIPVTPDSRFVKQKSNDNYINFIAPGQRVILKDLARNPELNGQAAIVLRAVEVDSRWLVRVETDRDGAPRLVAARPTNLQVADDPYFFYPDESTDAKRIRPFAGRVFAFWGDARWSRTQLLGEIARGHWGMCKSTLAEILAPPHGRRDTLNDRLVFAPLTAMTEASIATARSQMAPLRQQALAAAAAHADDEISESPALNDSPRTSSVPMSDEDD
mmetsp:Transcript_13779/g.18392  ORF Transcript_13779/g.18392 Transcript_13779/m.18392 type:complete len:549 (+) Transcript_13779:13-1659(+)